MASIDLQNVTKRFGKITALNDISLSVKDKEFFVLFGPAGAGKTTILKTIAGIQFADNGVVCMNGERVNNREPAHRNVAMVFENYALYPHLNVYDNIASPLRSKLYRKSETEIADKVAKVTSTMKIDHLTHRLPSQLSNGQRQRVALGRCLVRDPNVFLMDEPLAHLDAKLRSFMRTELKALQKQLNTTVIYVTHDYMEAMSLSDRMAIINEGAIEQVGTAREVYYTPTNEFVARLVGEPEINILHGELQWKNELALKLDIIESAQTIPPDVREMLSSFAAAKVDIGIRSNHIAYGMERNDRCPIQASVYSIEPIGNRSNLIAEINGVCLNIKVPNNYPATIGQDVWIGLDLEQAIFFDAETKAYLARHGFIKTGEGN